MKAFFQVIFPPSLWLVLDIFLPKCALAKAPGHDPTQIQPALILALALTSLVLFCIYLFQKSRAKNENQAGYNTLTGGSHPVQTRLHETHKALDSLFSHPGIPMAKTDLEQGKIIDVTPALCQALGYTKKSFLKESPENLGILPSKECEIRSLVEKGWVEFSACLCHKLTQKQLTCRILNIATQIEGWPMVLTIVPDLTEDHLISPACKTPQFVEDPR